MKQLAYIFTTILLLIFSSCSTDDVTTPDVDLTWEEDNSIPGPSATVKGFECGDQATRSSWLFNGQKMVFGWEKGDALGLYPTAGVAEDGKTLSDLGLIETHHPAYTDSYKLHLTDPTKAQSTPFYVLAPSTDSQTQPLHGNMGADFEWNNQLRWTAYKPFNPNFNVNAVPSVKYTGLPFDFSDQTQMGLTDMKALYVGTDKPKGYNNPEYLRTEAIACQHLANVDFSISPEKVWEGSRINFEFRHVGAIARIFLLAPAEDLKIEKLELICERKIFHAKGQVDITSHPYNSTETPNHGVRLIGDAGPLQITPTDEATQKLTLKFAQGVSVKKPTSENRYLNYLVAYLMMYPVTYNPDTDGKLYAYVTAKDSQNREVHFLSEELGAKTMKSGYYYEWTARTHEQDGLYPIELTATLLPWQDIVGAGINTDLEK